MFIAAPGMRIFSFFEHPFFKNDKQLVSNNPGEKKDPALAESIFSQTFIGKINTEFKNTPVTIEFETVEKSVKKVIGAFIANTGQDFIELKPAGPLIPIVVLTFISGAQIPFMEFTNNIVIRNIDRIISIGKA